MAKRRLTKQQQARIQRQHQHRIAKAGKGGETDDALLGPERRALVSARYSRHVDVRILDGDDVGRQVRCHVRATVGSIAVGDYVVWRSMGEDQGVVIAVEPRQSLIERPDGLGKLKPVAANIDRVFIVLAVEPEPHPTLIDRYLVAAENANIEAILVLNKMDLCQTPAQQSLCDELERIYTALDYRVYRISCAEKAGLEALRQELTDQVSVFVGQSGVGKSSLVNELIPETEAKVGELSDHVVKGRHTTTTSSLFALPGGGYLIDSPGIREFHLNHFDKPQIYAGYRELEPLLGTCQFRDCQHDSEPGCEIREFIDGQTMSDSRAQTLAYILGSLDDAG
ncbi:Small ribosomal subunit biogenesis GTPase RsgA [BD1-7 clade bacterium]|uniref:Small ribosomal subunit biogenesis GTPase RsgA n=1 Tax=BD1-7 clade bacterium TaxID=2029982 RepID=A0A5S9N7M7_9GAMM|nr:Small ribosomal subunit biogenesis GTPase RsgA [BD1-7 clade bacterium]CAA0085135.1 Small ribosomal subunit biogenesis GTPase RsgA [BD1-7 clade bacterium]